MSDVIDTSLPFKITISDRLYCQKYSSIFEYGEAEYRSAIAGWIDHKIVGDSEMAVCGLDGHWLSLFQDLFDNVRVHRNVKDDSSAVRRRPDAVVIVNGFLAMRQEAKFSSNDLDYARDQLTEGLHEKAYNLFPLGYHSTFGITASKDQLNLHLIEQTTSGFSSRILRSYNLMSSMDSRVDFIVDLFNIMRLLFHIKCPNSSFHLMPGVRMRTNNGHEITWLKDGILKNFKVFREHLLDRIGVIYAAVPQLRHVEWGRRINGKFIIITRVGMLLSKAVQLKLISHDDAIAQVILGLHEIHSKEFAHGDLKITNVFYDESREAVFLGDLEYLTPLHEPPPEVRGAHSSGCTTAREFDFYCLEELKLDVRNISLS